MTHFILLTLSCQTRRRTVVLHLKHTKREMSQKKTDEIIFYHWSDLMPEDVTNLNRVDLVFKIEDYQVTKCKEGLMEIEIYGRVSRDVKITVFTSCRDAESEPKLHRAYPFTKNLCWVQGVSMIDKHERYYHSCFPGSMRVYKLHSTTDFVKKRVTVDFPLQETDISSSAMEKISLEDFPSSDDIEQQICLDLYKEFFTN